MRGRRPSGTEVVDRQQGSSTAKERVKAVLDTIAGRCRVEEVCRRLGISEQRFRQLREEVLAGALAAAEPGKPGRPPRTLTPAEEHNQALAEQLEHKDVELRVAQARAEIALTLPRVLQKPGVTEASEAPPAATEKKTSRRPASGEGSAKRARRPPGTRKNT